MPNITDIIFIFMVALYTIVIVQMNGPCRLYFDKRNSSNYRGRRCCVSMPSLSLFTWEVLFAFLFMDQGLQWPLSEGLVEHYFTQVVLLQLFQGILLMRKFIYFVSQNPLSLGKLIAIDRVLQFAY
jgi:hypothetical protein